jgi:hypothetical protein
MLKAAEIEVKIENPNVGENLQEHMGRTQRSPDYFIAASS